ncbi:UNVERIFIED_ORG: hypothetical protein J2W38_007093 [Variovorax paradoxus]|jgi:hypothetical protein|nr:hypothetical protein [Variovorax paradoxus]
MQDVTQSPDKDKLQDHQRTPTPTPEDVKRKAPEQRRDRQHDAGREPQTQHQRGTGE